MSNLPGILSWAGCAAFGVTWGWLLGLWLAPRRRTQSPATAAGRPRFSHRWLRAAVDVLERVQKSRWGARLQRLLRVGFLALLVISPAVEVWAYGGAGLALLFAVAAATGFWLHRAWREYLMAHRPDFAGARREQR
ncbi:MAG: hypothetical protein RRC07_06170 [Anaerolineae bacterium]|nr:hypothetical protein [Anaerolineae bacterium]